MINRKANSRGFQSHRSTLRDIAVGRIVPLWVGLYIGGLLVYEAYAPSYFNRTIYTLLGHRWFALIKSVPFEFSILMFSLIAGICLLVVYLPRWVALMLEYKESLFLISFLVGYQANGLNISGLDASDFLVGIFSLLLLLSIFGGKDYTFTASSVNLLNLLLLFFFIISTVNTGSLFSLIALRQYLKSILLFFLMVNFLYSKEMVTKFIRWLIVITSCSSLIAITQEVVYLLTGQLLIGVIPADVLNRMFEPTSFGYLLRVPALMNEYRPFAFVLGVTLLMAISLLLFPNRLIQSSKERFFLFIACILMSTALILTFTHDVALGLSAALILLLVMRFAPYFLHFSAATLLIVSILLFSLTYIPGQMDNLQNFLKDLPSSERERFQLDREGIEGFLQGGHILIGGGQGAGARYTDHFLRWPAHNAFILIADDAGIFGLLVYILIYLWIIYRIIILNLRIRDPTYLPVVRGLAGGVIIHVFTAQFQGAYTESFHWVIYALIESIALISESKMYQVTQTSPERSA